MPRETEQNQQDQQMPAAAAADATNDNAENNVNDNAENAPMEMDADAAVGAEVVLNGNGDAAEAADEEANEPFYGFLDEEPAAAEEENAEDDDNFEGKEMTKVLQIWERKHTQSGFDPVPALKRLAEIFEKETEIYMRKDPDPFDERHPYRADPSCQFGFLLKLLFRKDHFMNKLVNDYLRDNYFTRQNIQKSALELNILACRLFLVIMPGLETSAVFQAESDNLINRIYGWAEDSIEPLQSYATGLLASAMEVTDIAVTFRELNTRLVPKMIKRLHMMQAIFKSRLSTSKPAHNDNAANTNDGNNSAVMERLIPNWMSASAPHSPNHESNNANNTAVLEENFANTSNMSALLENSCDGVGPSGTRYYRKMFIPICPPTTETSQMLILRYLTSMGEYQEFLGLVFENNAMQLIFKYIENLDGRDTCLAFEALKYLASLLCHKKFALEFIAHGGLDLLLKIPRPSIASTGVSITLYYLASSEDGMERICTMPRPIISELVRYALWLLGHSYDSGRCHATMFFGLSFQFKVILEEFDAQDGLRKLYNLISILAILNPTNADENASNGDVECASRQIVRHVCVALKRYMESHLFYKFNNFMRQQCPSSNEYSQNITKAAKANLEQISEQVRTLQENTSVRAHWAPVDQLLKLGGINLLLKTIALSYDWNNGGRSETLRSALDVLSICCVIPRVYTAYCERIELLDTNTNGISSILAAAAGDITTDADVQKSALAVLCHCICSPIARKEPNTLMKCFSASRKNKQNHRYSEELVEKVWESVCSNNGIIVLLSLMQVKAPITDADCIRGMACRALAGLARSERVRQIVGKLPLFTSGQIQTLMRDPILQEKRAEHVLFQKYALELLELISGKTKPINNQGDTSLANIHKANVVAQTKIQYNEQQLYQLIYDHLESKGMSQTAQMLQKEAGIQLPTTNVKSFHQSPFDYKVLPTSSSIARNRLRNRMHDVNNAINGAAVEQPNASLSDVEMASAAAAVVTPIKLVKRMEKNKDSPGNSGATNSASSTHAAQQRSLQKQISSFTDAIDEQGIISPPPNTNAGISLNTIVTEYLTNQHALCNNPMTTCPQFDLFTPHKCPDPKPNRLLHSNQNLTTRVFRAQAGYNTSRLDRRFVHSNFAPYRTIRSHDYNEIQFICCDIVSTTNVLIVGTEQGEAKAFNINDGTELYSYACHSYLIDSIKSNRSADLVLTSCSWRSPVTSVLWSIRNNEFASKLNFKDEFYCEFSNQVQDKVLGTQIDCCVIYDINTGNKVATFTPTIANQYTKNRATFNPTDELILSDGVIWDVRSGKAIHKFDKLNQTLSGVFHPNGLEIVSNTEVWDLRTFHLLQTVPVLDQCHIHFSPMNVLYGISLDTENRADFDDTANYDTSFKVLDSYDYSSIATIDVKRNIYDISINGNGSLIALVENQPAYDSKQETFVKIYAVGMKKTEQMEEDEDEEHESDDEGSDSDDDVRDVYRLAVDDPFGGGRRRRGRDGNNDEAGDDDEDDDDDDDDDDSDDDDSDDSDDSDNSAGWIDMDDSDDESMNGGDDNAAGGGNNASGSMSNFLRSVADLF